MTSGYEQIRQWQFARLAGCDLAAQAQALGLGLRTPGLVQVRFFGRDYLADAQGVRPADGRPASPQHLSLVAHYVQSPGRGAPAYEFVPFSRLSGPMPGRGALGRAEDPGEGSFSRALAARFDGDQPGLRAAAARLEGQTLEEDASGGRAWLFHPFPKMPLKLVVHEADEEFPSSYRPLFDLSATAFMEFEALGFLAGVFLREMLGL